MTRGLGGQSPANVAFYIKGVEFPATKQDLMRRAKENGAEAEVLDMIGHMPDNRYETAADVMKGYGEADRPSQSDTRH